MVVKVKVLDVDGKIVELRIRKNRRIAIREDLPTPPAVVLKCMGEQLEMRLVTRQYGYAVYYMPATAYRRLLDLATSATKYEVLPCVFSPAQLALEEARHMEECKIRCVYVNNRPLEKVLVLLLREAIARVVVIIGCNFYTFAFKEEAKEFLRQKLRQKLGVENFEVKPCQ